MSTVEHSARQGFLAGLNGRYHRAAMLGYLFIVLAHWAEHLVQAFQIYGLGWETPEARGVLGMPFPWLVESEWLHYGYALIMLVGLWLLRKGMAGRAYTWWMIAFWIQVWHHFEHFILLLQALVGQNLFGMAAPVSLVQLIVPRVELHLFYNTVVFIPMVIAMYLHLRPRAEERELMSCTCASASLAGQR